jgi:hypothetical protein
VNFEFQHRNRIEEMSVENRWRRYDRKQMDLTFCFSAGPTRLVGSDHLRLLDDPNCPSRPKTTSYPTSNSNCNSATPMMKNSHSPLRATSSLQSTHSLSTSKRSTSQMRLAQLEDALQAERAKTMNLRLQAEAAASQLALTMASLQRKPS